MLHETLDKLPTLEQLKIKLLEEGERRGIERELIQDAQQAYPAHAPEKTESLNWKAKVKCYNCAERENFKK